MVTLFLLFQALPAFGVPTISDPTTLTQVYQNLVPTWLAAVYPYAQDVFAALLFLDFAAFGISLWREHDGSIQRALLSTTNQLLVAGIFLSMLLNGPVWMADIIDMFITVGKAGSGIPSIQPSVVLTQGVTIAGGLLWQAMQNGMMLDVATSIALVAAALIILLSFLVITIEFIITKIQTFLVLGMGIFFFAFGGSKWTRTYVERYFAYAFSSGIRLMTLYFLIGAGFQVSNSWIAQAQNAPWTQSGVMSAWIIMAGAVIYGMICWRGPAIAAQILGGGPNLSHNEVFSAIGTAVSAGAAAALIASGAGGAIAGAAGGAAASSGGGAVSSGGAAAPAAGRTPTSSPSGGGAAVNGFASAAARAGGTLQGMGGSGGGHVVRPPNFNGFGQ